MTKLTFCDLTESFLLNKDVSDLYERVLAHVFEALQYSSQFRFSHLSDSGFQASDTAVKDPNCALLESTNALFWLEVLSLLILVGQSTTVAHNCAVFFKVSLIFLYVLSTINTDGYSWMWMNCRMSVSNWIDL